MVRLSWDASQQHTSLRCHLCEWPLPLALEEVNLGGVVIVSGSHPDLRCRSTEPRTYGAALHLNAEGVLITPMFPLFPLEKGKIGMGSCDPLCHLEGFAPLRIWFLPCGGSKSDQNPGSEFACHLHKRGLASECRVALGPAGGALLV